MDLATSDGIKLNDDALKVYDIYCETILNYYNNFINNNSEYYDFGEYITSHSYDEFVKITFPESFNNNDYGLYGMRLMNSITNNSVGITNVTDQITVSSKEVTMPDGTKASAVYQCNITQDGNDTGIIMLFDENGNLLNFNDENMSIEFVPTFPNGL